ncbi:MAG: magnesium and cobalt transport protein CorA, partial [Proteobacteria bacterium]|nr:magnesium and cobalt transport protein CorA [Pseudomonadota bacterium]
MGLFSQRYSPPGLPAGALIQPEEESPRPLRISLMDYGAGEVFERASVTAEECKAYLETPTITWIHVQGGFEPEILRDLGNTFSLHPLALEDVITSGHRPKAEIYGDQVFVVLSRP